MSAGFGTNLFPIFYTTGTREVQQYANLAAFPATGEVATLYIAADTGLVYRWDGVAYAVTGLQPIADQTILGNVSGGSAIPVALTISQVKALLGLPTEVALSADISVNSPTTEILHEFSVIADKFYEVEFIGGFTATLATVGAYLTIDPNADETGDGVGENYGCGYCAIQSGTTTMQFSNQTNVSSSGSSFTTIAVAVANATQLNMAHGRWIFKAINSGTVQLRFGAETTGSTHTMKAGISRIRIWER